MAWSDAARRAAAEVRRLRARNARLFHGTTSKVRRVTPSSFNPREERRRATFLTTDPKEARQFAKGMAEERGGNPVVYMVRARRQKRLMSQGAYGRHAWVTTSKVLSEARRLTVKR
jgi:hypothetical protein